jgi:hypothetical protein
VTIAHISAVNGCRAIAGVRTLVSNDDPKEPATLRAFERLHHVPSGDSVTSFTIPLTLLVMHSGSSFTELFLSLARQHCQLLTRGLI